MCSHISKIVSKIILKTILFQINNCRNEGDWKSTAVWARLFFWETQVSNLVFSQLLKTFPFPLYIQTFSFCSSSGQASKSQFFPSWSSSRSCFISRSIMVPLLLTPGVLLPWGSSFGTGTPLIFALHIPISLLFPPLPKCSSRFPPWAEGLWLQGELLTALVGNISFTFPRPWPHHLCV